MNNTGQNQLGHMVNLHTSTYEDGTLTAEDFSTPVPISPEGKAVLRSLENDGQNLLHDLEEQIESSQEKFIALLRNNLRKNAVKLEDRLHLYLSSDGQLVVEGNDNDAERVHDIIAKKPILQSRFKELARLALLSHGIDVACQAHKAMKTPPDDEGIMFSRFHAYLKGQLSHFCVR
ncbi:MAG: hypothetical protein J5838_02645 [Desulfovibrio sp.]|nr:hypothetical protein [Desulfovibrio sp.]